MSAAPGPPQGAAAARHAEQRPRRTALWVAGAVTAVILLVVGITAATGGFAADGGGPDVVATGTPVDQVKFSSVALSAAWERHKLDGKSHRYIVARLRVTNTSDRTVPVNDYIQSVIPLQAWGGSILQEYKAYSGGTETDTLQPGIPTDLTMQLTPDKGQEAATTLNLRFCAYDHDDDFFYGHKNWMRACANWYGIFLPDKQRRANAYNTNGIAAQVNVPVKGGA
jgi:hypothetical protein